MKTGFKRSIGIALIMLLSCCFMQIVYAAQSGEQINKISIKVTSSVKEGTTTGIVSATTGSSEYSIASCEFKSEPNGSWKPGDIPKVSIVLEADSDYYFNKSIRSSKVSLSGADYSSIKFSEDAKTVTLTVKLDKVEGTLSNVGGASWNSSVLGKAEWDDVENANAYELKLYKGGNVVYKIDRITTTSVNLFPYMTRKGSYYYRVRAIPRNSSEKDYLTESQWVESGELEIDTRQAARAESIGNSGSTASGTSHSSNSGGPGSQPSSSSQYGWIKNNDGWWYKNVDGSYPKNGWQLINGKWYLFDVNGYMKTGWQRYEGNMYYLTRNGDMQTGWLEDNRLWYYFLPNGEIAVDWVNVDGKWYFMNQNGTMRSGWIQWKGYWYYLNPMDGSMAVNTYINQYYVNADGIWIQ